MAEGSASEQRAQEQHLARWLSKRLDLPVRLYDLRPQGFELVGGRLLPDSSGPSAQRMYQNGNGQRITLYLRRWPASRTILALRAEASPGSNREPNRHNSLPASTQQSGRTDGRNLHEQANSLAC